MTLRVEVIYAQPQQQRLIELEVADGTTVAQALALSGVLENGDMEGRPRFGIFGRVVDVTTILRDGDRVEIYRPLVADPKEVRRARVQSTKVARRSRTG